MDREAGAGGGASTAASVTVNTPAGTVAGDVMIAAMTADGGTGVTITAPGWTAIRLSTNTTVIATRAFYKITLEALDASPVLATVPDSDEVDLLEVFIGCGTSDGTQPFEIHEARRELAARKWVAGIENL